MIIMALGDHIFVYRFGYSHHGIDGGNDRVIHFESSAWQKLRGAFSSKRAPCVREVSCATFSQGRPILVRQYGGGHQADDAEKAVERARSRLGRQDYGIFQNNCEHFVVWCKTGRAKSTQIEALCQAGQTLRKSVTTAAFVLRWTRYLPPPLRLWGYGVVAVAASGVVVGQYVNNRLASAQRRES